MQTKDYNNVGEDDNQTVTGVEGSPGGIGYFGYSFFQENADTLKAAEVDGGDGCVAPSEETVQDGTYAPLGRELYMYVNTAELESNEALQPFVDYYLEHRQRRRSADRVHPAHGRAAERVPVRGGRRR